MLLQYRRTDDDDVLITKYITMMASRTQADMCRCVTGVPKHRKAREQSHDESMPDSVDRVVWDDVIQMHEITRLEDFLCEEDDISADAQGIFAIHTSSKGRNRGRKYCLQVVGLVTSALAAEFADIDADNSGDITIDELRAAMRRLNANVTEEEVQQKWRGMDLNGDGKVSKKEFRSAEGLTGSKGHRQLEECDVSELMETIDVLVAAAKKNQVRAQRGCATSLFMRSRAGARRVFQSLPFQLTVASLIAANFCINIYEAQMLTLVPDSTQNETLRSLDLFFTVVFTAELALNLYCTPAHAPTQTRTRAHTRTQAQAYIYIIPGS